MQRLKKFNTKDINKKPVIIIVGIFVIVISLIVGISFAEYKTEDEVLFINAKVADFRVSLSNITATSTNNSVSLSYTVGGLNPIAECVFKTNSEGNYDIAATSTNNNSCTRNNLSPNTTYYYQVCTHNNLNQWACKEGNINTKYDPPTLSNITATSTTNSIKLTYTSGGYAENFACWYGTSADNMKTSAPMSFSECNITGLQPGTTYYYNVNLRNNGGEAKKTGSIATKLNPPTVSNITATSTYNTINLSYTMSGTITGRTCKYGTTNGSYTNSVSNPSNTGCKITNLKSNTPYYYQVCGINSAGQDCKTGSIKTATLLSDVAKVGDYVSMTPTSTSYTISKDLTGYTKDQTINPSELNLWRIISVHANGTIEMVSVKVSYERVYFRGPIGYMNLIGGLNSIATQYTDGKHVQSTRHMGYKKQTETCTESIESCPSDTEYQTDAALVESAVGSLRTFRVGGSTNQQYWLASRVAQWPDSNDGIEYQGRIVTSSGEIRGVKLSEETTNVLYSEGLPVRPITTLKSTSVVEGGAGSSSSPYILN